MKAESKRKRSTLAARKESDRKTRKGKLAKLNALADEAEGIAARWEGVPQIVERLREYAALTRMVAPLFAIPEIKPDETIDRVICVCAVAAAVELDHGQRRLDVVLNCLNNLKGIPGSKFTETALSQFLYRHAGVKAYCLGALQGKPDPSLLKASFTPHLLRSQGFESLAGLEIVRALYTNLGITPPEAAAAGEVSSATPEHAPAPPSDSAPADGGQATGAPKSTPPRPDEPPS